MSVVGGDEAMAVIARGTLVELGPAMARVRLDEGAAVPDVRSTVVVVVHRTNVEMVLGSVVAGETEPRMLRIARVARAD